jgi:hypothetical protein
VRDGYHATTPEQLAEMSSNALREANEKLTQLSLLSMQQMEYNLKQKNICGYLELWA